MERVFISIALKLTTKASAPVSYNRAGVAMGARALEYIFGGERLHESGLLSELRAATA